MPCLNVLNGGAHAANSVDIQEFMIIPGGFPSYRRALRAGVEVYHSLKKVLAGNGLTTNVGDEGGFAPNLGADRAALELLAEAVEASGYELGGEIAFGLDVAATELHRAGMYELDGRQLKSLEMVDYLESLVDEFPLVTIEDGLAENDWDGWAALTARLGDRVQLVGDDVFVTDDELVQRGIDNGVANAVLIKLNQIGLFRRRCTRWSWPRATTMAGWSAIVPAKPKTPSSAIWPWQPTPVRSKRGRQREPSERQSTTSCCASRPHWAGRPVRRVGRLQGFPMTQGHHQASRYSRARAATSSTAVPAGSCGVTGGPRDHAGRDFPLPPDDRPTAPGRPDGGPIVRARRREREARRRSGCAPVALRGRTPGEGRIRTSAAGETAYIIEKDDDPVGAVDVVPEEEPLDGRSILELAWDFLTGRDLVPDE